MSFDRAAYMREWHKRNREKSRANNRRFYHSNKSIKSHWDYPKNGGKRTSRLRRNAPWLKADPCAYCGAPMEEVDHIIPSSAGGSDDWYNLTASCLHCNRSKHNKSLLLFLLHHA